jgi:hypothetical protein
MSHNDHDLPMSETELLRRAAQLRADYLSELFGALRRRIRAAFTGRAAAKDDPKLGDRVGGAHA